MSQYIRSQAKGATFFFTVVANERKPFLTGDIFRRALRESIREVQAKHPFVIDAWVLLPDHLHCIWTLPPNDNRFSKRWGMIKALTTKRINLSNLPTHATNRSRKNKREGSLWQRRFWEHQIRDENDLNRHLDYLHFNPVKHEMVAQAADWPYSTFHRYVKNGYYQNDWGENREPEYPVGE